VVHAKSPGPAALAGGQALECLSLLALTGVDQVEFVRLRAQWIMRPTIW
jgi:hypothetical protein